MQFINQVIDQVKIKLTYMRLLIFMVLLVSYAARAQDEYFSSASIADCAGAVEILNPGSYSVQFTNGSGLLKDLTAFPQLADVKEKNSLFFKYSAPFDGKLSFDASIPEGMLQVFVFQNSSEDIVSDILQGTALLKREIKGSTEPDVGLSVAAALNRVPALDLKKDETVIIMFNTSKKGEKLLDFDLKYELLADVVNSDSYRKIVDERKTENAKTFHIIVRDAETGNPVIADVNIKGKRNSSLYSGSDFFFPIENQAKLVIKCDAPGYFFSDKDITLSADSSKELTISLRPVSQGKTLKIDKIEFVRGTADIIPGTESILKRVKDFLVLNAGIKIEIQGHVNDEGGEKLTTKGLSKRRAKKVMRYFIQSGVSRDRLRHVGFGNQKPIYSTPKTDREEQANRRVEIKIL